MQIRRFYGGSRKALMSMIQSPTGKPAYNVTSILQEFRVPRTYHDTALLFRRLTLTGDLSLYTSSGIVPDRDIAHHERAMLCVPRVGTSILTVIESVIFS